MEVVSKGKLIWPLAVTFVTCGLIMMPAGRAGDGSAAPSRPAEAKASQSPLAPSPTPTPTPTPAPVCQDSGHQTVVYLDPGHGVNLTPGPAASGGSEGIYSGESANGQEDIDVFAVAMKAKAGLEEAGYQVVLSRETNPDQAGLSLWEKGNAAQVANDGQPADIAISIHTDTASSIGAGQIYYNKLGGYRQNSGDGLRQTFTNEATAATAKQYAEVFQAVRSQDQQATITITAGHDFPAGRNLGSYGDIPIVMLSAPDVPWVYNEFGRTSEGGLTEAQIDTYAGSIVRATEEAIGPNQGTGEPIQTCNWTELWPTVAERLARFWGLA